MESLRIGDRSVVPSAPVGSVYGRDSAYILTRDIFGCGSGALLRRGCCAAKLST